MRPLLVYGARPNFMKIAPIYRAMADEASLDPVLVHTGQHFDPSMSDDIIAALELPTADIHLDVGQASQATQVATIMQRLEAVVERTRPDCVVVVGDVSSTLAAALTCDMVHVPLAHVEAGLRSRNWEMPEERNRVFTDRLSRWLFAPSSDAVDNLLAEGVEGARIHLVGNVMIDSLDWVLPRVDQSAVLARYGVDDRPFAIATIHRASNVDDPLVLARLVEALNDVAGRLPLLFAAHPRTRDRLTACALSFSDGVRVLPPLNYPEFTGLLANASVVLTDSGGIQEEAVVLGVPCLTLREETERPTTLVGGRNVVVGTDPRRIAEAMGGALSRRAALGPFRPEYWDGKAAWRIVSTLLDELDEPTTHPTMAASRSRLP